MNTGRFPLRAWLAEKFGKSMVEHGDGAEVTVPCPECPDGEGELWINVVKGKAVCYRNSCGASARNLVQLIALVDGCSLYEASQTILALTERKSSDFRKEIKRRLTSEEPEEAPTEEGEIPEVELPDGFTFWSDALHKPPYFAERGLSPEDCREYGLGFTYQGRYKGRLIVPVVFGGKLVSFVARDMTGKAERKVLDPPKAPKKRILFNYDRASQGKVGVLTEGVFDAIRVGPSGMALLGTNLSEEQTRLLLAAEFEDVVVLLDPDAWDKSQKLAAKLRDAGVPARAVRLVKGDPDDYSRRALWRLIGQAPRDALRARLALL